MTQTMTFVYCYTLYLHKLLLIKCEIALFCVKKLLIFSANQSNITQRMCNELFNSYYTNSKQQKQKLYIACIKRKQCKLHASTLIHG
jgi:hypothetical protein